MADKVNIWTRLMWGLTKRSSTWLIRISSILHLLWQRAWVIASDVDRYVIFRILLHSTIFNIFPIFISRWEIHTLPTYTQFLFRKVAYTSYNVNWLVQYMNFRRTLQMNYKPGSYSTWTSDVYCRWMTNLARTVHELQTYTADELQTWLVQYMNFRRILQMNYKPGSYSTWTSDVYCRWITNRPKSQLT
jgi:hypothetical protein